VVGGPGFGPDEDGPVRAAHVVVPQLDAAEHDPGGEVDCLADDRVADDHLVGEPGVGGDD
jgi:hypothetical protein